jgi:hypothetical protein
VIQGIIEQCDGRGRIGSCVDLAGAQIPSCRIPTDLGTLDAVVEQFRQVILQATSANRRIEGGGRGVVVPDQPLGCLELVTIVCLWPAVMC